MYGQLSKPRKLLWPVGIGIALGILILVMDGEWKTSLIGFVPAAIFVGVFVWAAITEKRI
ncbi:MAG: hypothetical protein HQ503_02755 [Rhodospirillales bacterium]|nr:hypothetical protein [Rhodospirillales bacterium]